VVTHPSSAKRLADRLFPLKRGVGLCCKEAMQSAKCRVGGSRVENTEAAGGHGCARFFCLRFGPWYLVLPPRGGATDHTEEGESAGMRCGGNAEDAHILRTVRTRDLEQSSIFNLPRLPAGRHLQSSCAQEESPPARPEGAGSGGRAGNPSPTRECGSGSVCRHRS
jgi:hypothetical protein